MASAIAGLSSNTATQGSSSTAGLNTMTGADFLNLMIQQLQQQDPLNPTDSNQLLTQISQISTLQSNNAMTTQLQGLTLQQSIGAGGNLIGKTVQGLTESGDSASGIVTSVKVANKQVYLEMDSGQEMPLGNVTSIAETSPAAAAATGTSTSNTTPNLSALMSLLSALGAK